MKDTPRIGVIVPASLELARQVVRGVHQYCNAHPPVRLDLISANAAVPNTQQHVDPDPRRKCIIAYIHDEASLESLSRISPHVVVTTNRRAFEGCPRVINDDLAVGRLGAEYLLSKGYRQLAFVSRMHLNFAKQRMAGFLMEAKNREIEPLVFEDWNQDNIEDMLQRILSLGEPVGLMAASDLFARLMLEGMENPDKWVPHRIGVLGVDDDSLEQSLAPVGFSSIRLSGERLGYEAAAMGMRLAGGEPMTGAPLLIAPNRVVARQSTSNLGVGDTMVARALRLIEDRMTEFGDANDLVVALKVPRRTVENRFRKALRSTPAQELTRARLARARKLLATTELSVKEIAFLVGFSEPRMLTLVFKRESGETPSRYRSRVNPGG